MAGHSKWKQIKHKKGITDAKRGKIFSKISRMITLAARGSDQNPGTNQKLRIAVERGKAVNMPRDVIERAIDKATNKNELVLEEFLYEAYGPDGVAVLIEGITDSKNRSTQEIKHLVSESGGKFASPGTVLWMFEKKGVVELPLEKNTLQTKEEWELSAIDAGADSINEENGTLFMTVPSQEIHLFVSALAKKGATIETSFIAYIPKTTMKLTADGEDRVGLFLNAIEENDDVQEVYANIE